jgi:hypothetical protein
VFSQDLGSRRSMDDSLGTISAVVEGGYRINWDDGFVDDDDTFYGADELDLAPPVLTVVK